MLNGGTCGIDFVGLLVARLLVTERYWAQNVGLHMVVSLMSYSR